MRGLFSGICSNFGVFGGEILHKVRTIYLPGLLTLLRHVRRDVTRLRNTSTARIIAEGPHWAAAEESPVPISG